jgi:hypothetical protein
VVTVEGHLRARDEPGQYSIAAVVGWTDAAGVQRRTPISVGPVTVEHERRKMLAVITKASQNFLKDLGLPLAFLWLAYRIKQLEEQRQESTRNREEEEREGRQKRAEEETARVRQTWTQMLPKVHENTERYYMPLMGFARSAAGAHRGKHSDEVLFYYLRFLARVKEMTDAIGGFYLKRRVGENIVGEIWDVLRARADDRFTRPSRQELQVTMRLVGTLSEFNAFSPETTIGIQRKAFAIPGALAMFAADAALLHIFSVVLVYETNQSYQFWYEEAEVFPEAEFVQALGELRGQDGGGEFGVLIGSLEQYVVDIRTRKNNTRPTR